MNDVTESSTNFGRRIGILANGPVGNAIVAKLISYAPKNLISLVIANNETVSDLIIPDGCDVVKWAKEDETLLVERLLSKRLDVVILAWWPYLLKGPILQAASVMLNTHPSLLPYCRGKDPNFWSIVDRVPFGVTLHHVTEEIDGGDIAFQKEIPTSWSDTGETLYLKSLTAMVELVSDSLPAIVNGTIPRIAQPRGGSLHYRSQLDAASVIDLDAPTTARELLNRLRARTFPPHPACHFRENDGSYEVRVEISKVTDRDIR